MFKRAMAQKRHKLTSLILSSLLCCAAIAHGAAISIRSAPENPEFTDWRNAERQAGDGVSFGFFPPPVAIPPIKPHKKYQGALPTSYDLRTLGKVSPVKDQGKHGTCWTFATFADLESGLLPSEKWDFSENNLANWSGYATEFDWGGNAFISAAYLLRWSGPYAEKNDRYAKIGFCPLPTVPIKKHVQGVYFLPERTDFLDNDAIKTLILEHGAVYCSFYYNSGYFDDKNNTYYLPIKNGGNHAVAIVGWDDAFAASKFTAATTPPPGNGAFLVKNSWGKNWGDKGYFWLTYYDNSLGYLTLFYRAEETNNYAGISQYDPLGWVGSVGVAESDTVWVANVFTATETAEIKAIGFYMTSANGSYDAYIYTGLTGDSPVEGQPAATLSGNTDYPGFYTFDLQNPPSVNQGDKFSVALKLTTPGYQFPAAVEYHKGDFTKRATANPGESYMSANGTEWVDLTDSYDKTANFCVKTYGPSNADGLIAPLTVSPGTEFDIISPVGSFEKKPQVLIVGPNLGNKKQSLKVLTKKYPCETVRCQWKGKAPVGTYSLYMKRVVKDPYFEYNKVKPPYELLTNKFKIIAK